MVPELPIKPFAEEEGNPGVHPVRHPTVDEVSAAHHAAAEELDRW